MATKKMDNPGHSRTILHSSHSKLCYIERTINTIVQIIGTSIAWLTLTMALLTAAVVFMRYGLDLGGIAIQESVIYMHAAVFMLAAAYTLQTEGHVRVDVFYRKFSPKGKVWVDLLGTLLLLLPTAIFMMYICWDYVMLSWRIGEHSQEASGLPIVYILKSLLLAMPFLLTLQAISHLIKYIHQLFFSFPENSTTQPDIKE